MIFGQTFAARWLHEVCSPTVAGKLPNTKRQNAMNAKETELADKILTEALAAKDPSHRNDLLCQYELIMRAACTRKSAES